MRRRLPAFLAALLPLFGVGGIAVAAPPPAPPISGVVRHLERPIAGALVIFYDLVAYKRGFLPALVRLWHQALPESVSAVEIKLAAASREPGAPSTPSTLWDLRDRLPADV